MRKYELGIENELSELVTKIIMVYPNTRERSLAITHLEECIMWLQHAKMRTGETPEDSGSKADRGQPA